MSVLRSHREELENRCEIIDVSGIARLFRFVSFGNYVLLVVSGNMLLYSLDRALWTSSSVAEVLAHLISMVIFSFTAWVGWRNIGVLGAVKNRYTQWALLAMGVYFAFVGMLLIPSVLSSLDAGSNKRDDDAFLVAAASLIFAPACFAGLVALSWLRHLTIPVLDIRLSTFLQRSLPSGRKGMSLPAVNRTKGAVFLGLGVVILIACDYIPDLLPKSLDLNTRLRLSQISQFGFVLLVYARHNLRPDFQTVRSNDHRAPVIFLRSFEDDEKLNYSKADSALFDFSLESRLADHFSAVGPFIAVGKPGDDSPHLGAARASLLDSEWQGTVKSWMAESALILVMIGRTQWVDWELRRIVESAQIRKLIILFPQTRKALWNVREDGEARLDVIERVFAETPWAAGLGLLGESIRARRIRSITFLPEGKVAAVVSSPRNRESYHLAALIAQYRQLRPIGDAEAESLATVRRRTRGWVFAAGTFSLVALGVILPGAYLASHGGVRFLNTPIAIEPLPSSIPVKSNGKLIVGNLKWIDAQTGAARSAVYHPGETIKFSYMVGGFGIGKDGKADVTASSRFQANDGSSLDVGEVRFNNAITEGERISFTDGVVLLSKAKPGEFWIAVKLRDAVLGAEYEFRPKVRVETANP